MPKYKLNMWVAKKSFWTLHFYFLLPTLNRKSAVFGINFSKLRFCKIYTFWGLLNPKIIFITVSPSFFVCVNSTTQKRAITETRCLAFTICITCRWYLQVIIKMGKIVYTQWQTYEFQCITSNRRDFLLF